MKSRFTAMIAAAGFAALGAWYNAKRRRRSMPILPGEYGESELPSKRRSTLAIDDDTAAEIIRRARPALERARDFL